MKEAGTVIVFLVSSNINSFRVMTLKDGKKGVRKTEEHQSMPRRLQTPALNELSSSVQIPPNQDKIFFIAFVQLKKKKKLARSQLA